MSEDTTRLALTELIADYRQEKEIVMRRVESRLERIEEQVSPSLGRRLIEISVDNLISFVLGTAFGYFLPIIIGLITR